MFRAGKVLTKGHALAPDSASTSARPPVRASAVSSESARRLRTPFRRATKAVHYEYFHGVLEIFLGWSFLIQVVKAASMRTRAYPARRAASSYFARVPLRLTYHRRQHLEFCALLQLEHRIHHLIYGLLAE